MFRIQPVPRTTEQLRTLTTRARNSASLIYEGLLKPGTEAEVVYIAVSSEIQKLRGCARAGIPEVTTNDRRLMHEYASTLMLRDPKAEAPAALNPLYASRVHSIVKAQREQYRRHHPLQTRVVRATI